MTTPFPTEAAALDALARRYSGDEWIFVRNVPDTTGGANRRADAVAMNCWRSRGLEIHGFEVKTDRRDLLRELKDPAKADAIAVYCDRWWLVLGSRDLLKDKDVIPGPWGILVPRGGDLVVHKRAGALDAQPPRRSFVAAVLRCVMEQKSDKGRIDEAYQAGRRAAEQSLQAARKYARREVEELKKTVREFETASGVGIRAWQAGDIGAAVKVVLNDTPAVLLRRLEEIRAGAEGIERCAREVLGKAKE